MLLVIAIDDKSQTAQLVEADKAYSCALAGAYRPDEPAQEKPEFVELTKQMTERQDAELRQGRDEAMARPARIIRVGPPH
ncbi:hypothetical protein [Paracoccus sediminicola]|uniref:hypothetical protein n=1 Tax=Paracoccus sediminicola TaxID=3017783 RepID=UPI0022F0FA02|nr:hypothetical protein [Paracoccus sediminicola]WBU55683.1 hypothetical protein PAF18_09090 [Paracoccus sediminicola]